MTIYNRPDEQVFAKNAEPQDIATFPDLERGWGVTYDDLGGIPPMEWFNFVGKRADEAINYLLQRGVAEWSPTMEYPKQAITIKSGQVFFALQQNTNKDPFTNTDVWVNSFAQKANQSDFERLNNSLIGSVQMFAYDRGQAPEDFLWCDGGLYNPQDYPKLFEKIGYTWGRSGSKFATPNNAEDNRFPRCGGGKLAVSMTQGDAIRNITGNLNLRPLDSDREVVSSASGAFSREKVESSFVGIVSAPKNINYYTAVRFNASRVVQTAEENRPNSIIYMFAIKYK